MDGTITRKNIVTAAIVALLLGLMLVASTFALSAPPALAEEAASATSITAQADMSRTVYVSKSGGKYHYVSNCSGMRNPKTMTLGEAIAKGYTACSNCVHESSDPDPVTPTPVTGYRGYTDLDPSAWYVTDGWIDSVLDRGLMSGYSGTTLFGPYDNVTRGQVAVILYRYDQNKTANTTDNNVGTRFSDVPSGQYYSAAVSWASDIGVVTGYESTGYTTFGPDNPVNREQLALMIARYVGYKTSGTGLATVPAADSAKFYSLQNADKVDSWARDGMVYCCDKGIMGGIGGTDLAPLDNAWRASMAKMITVTVRDVL